MIDQRLLDQLRRIVGAEHVAAGRRDSAVYAYDASLAVGAPEAVVLPADTRQTAAAVLAAAQAGVPYVARGFGTNLSGGSVAVRGGLVIGLSRLNRILAVKPEGRYAVVQAGVTNLELQNALAPLGFSFAPDPASQKAATLGGNAAENSGGPHCLKYGVTANHVLGATVVLPCGAVVGLGGPALDPPGYDLRGLLIGSEGTLGIMTELVVRILPLPESVLTLLAVYDDVADAARSVSAIIAAGIVPATLEMMDAAVIRAVEDSRPCGYPRDAAAVLIAEVDGPAAGLAGQADRIRELCAAQGCREVRQAKDAAERERLWAGRRGAFGAVARLSPNYLVTDGTVPRTRLPEALARVAAIAAAHRLAHGNVFHAGDGNLHPLLLFDSRDKEQVERVHRAGREIMEVCAALGGTITGEHGVGIEKAEALRMVYSEDDLEFQRRLRDAIDPHALCNPGKVLPPRTSEGATGFASADERATGHPSDHAAVEEKLPESTGRASGTPLGASGAPLGADGTPPAGELTPAGVAEACAIVRECFRSGRALLPVGHGTQADFGNYSDRAVTVLRTTRLSGVAEYDPANQVVVVAAGTPLESLEERLAEHGQWLPLRPPQGCRRTVGGIVALGACGPERLRYGAPRDLLLGLKFVSGTGTLISAGGRVVKNVAGYDVTRLMAGSAGTLGLLVELTFRVHALPSRCLAASGTGSLAQCATAAAALLRSRLEPVFVVAVPDHPSLRPGDAGAWQLTAGFEGFPETVEVQAERCRALIEEKGMHGRPARDYSPRAGAWGEPLDALGQAPFLLRADLPLDGVAGFLSARGELLRAAAVVADFGCGRITAAAPALADDAWEQCCRAACQAQGHVILEKSPREFRRRHEVFGVKSPDWPLQERIKAALDPGRVFAPGRMPGRV
jgi:glycolate oxidase subunit GlcD